MHTVPLAVPLSFDVDAERLFTAIEPAQPTVFWLDSGAGADRGWSFVGIGEPKDDLTALRDVALADARAPTAWPAGPFRGGWVGWFAYESGAAQAGAPAAVDEGAPADAWMRALRWVAIDHATSRAWAVAPAGEADAWARLIADALHPAAAAAAASAAVSAEPSGSATARGRHEPTDYEALIARCREAIRSGDAYQLCLTTRFEVETTADPVAVYRRLRAASAAHHAGFVRIRGVSMLSASPEEFLRVRSGIVRTRPIKGTRPRGVDPGSDTAAAEELLASEKERAENVMIVDLMRNDLARVCEVGTVRVDALLAIETYPQVHQLVSTVSGHLRPGIRLGELLARAFPAGSMTGAPKLSAMTILHALEGAPRGAYSGCFGWVADDGDLDLAMVIRTIVMREGRALVGAGGGITWSSVAADEVREVGVKARAPLAALGAELPPGW